MRLKRFIVSSICAMFVVLFFFVWLIYYFPDHISPSDPAPTTGEEICRFICMVSLWPFVVSSLLLHGDPPLLIEWLLLWIVTGGFWGGIIELFFMAKGWFWPKIWINKLNSN